MKISSKDLKKIENFAKSKVENLDEWHNWFHTVRTVKLAQYLARKEKADVNICIIAALLHDIGQSIKYEKHNLTGAEMAEEFLRKLDFDDKFIKQVKHCIISHDSKYVKKAKTVEAKVVYDADMLQVIGPFGFIRVLISYMETGKAGFNKSFKFAKWLENLTYLKYLQTKTAKKIAKKGYELMKKFYKLFSEEDKLRGLK